MLTQACFQVYLSELVESITASHVEVSTIHSYDRVIHVSGSAYRQLYQLQFKIGVLLSSGLLLEGIRDHSHKPLGALTAQTAGALTPLRQVAGDSCRL